MTKDLNNFGGASMSQSGSNCKLTTVESIRNLWSASIYDTPEEKVIRFKNFFARGRTVISLNTIIPELKDFLVKNFNVHSLVEVPVGYSSTPQYHIIINNNKGYWKEAKKENAFKIKDTDNLEEILTKTLKAKRRKTDIVQDILANLKK